MNLEKLVLMVHLSRKKWMVPLVDGAKNEEQKRIEPKNSLLLSPFGDII